ncbi:MAG: transposase [Methyloglobulus sp.]|nr:transposase [Methyloglobulus sp.]
MNNNLSRCPFLLDHGKARQAHHRERHFLPGQGGLPVPTGHKWRLLPKDFPPWQTVYDPWRRWGQRGVWEKVLDALNEAHRKKTAGGPRRVIPAGHKWPCRSAKRQDGVCQRRPGLRRRKAASATS